MQLEPIRRPDNRGVRAQITWEGRREIDLFCGVYSEFLEVRRENDGIVPSPYDKHLANPLILTSDNPPEKKYNCEDMSASEIIQIFKGFIERTDVSVAEIRAQIPKFKVGEFVGERINATVEAREMLEKIEYKVDAYARQASVEADVESMFRGFEGILADT